MARRKEILYINDGVTKLGGFNVGKYPHHQFALNRLFSGQSGWPLKLDSTGNDEWIKGCLRYRKNSCVFALELVEKGSFLHVQNGRRNIVRPGELFIVHQGMDSEMSVYKCEHAFKKSLELSGTILPALLHATGLDKCDVVCPNDIEWITAQFDEVYSLCLNGGIDAMRKCSAIAFEILLELGRNTLHKEYPQKLQNILSYLEQNVANNLTVDAICRKYTVSPATLHRLFNRHLGKSPIEYFIQMKIDSAKELLVTAVHYSIKEIASQFGYENQSYFATEFKKRVGVSPREYRVHRSGNSIS